MKRFTKKRTLTEDVLTSIICVPCTFLPAYLLMQLGLSSSVVGWLYLPLVLFAGWIALAQPTDRFQDSAELAERQRFDTIQYRARYVAAAALLVFAFETHPRSQVQISLTPGMFSSDVAVQNQGQVTFVDVQGRIRLIDSQGKFKDIPVSWNAWHPSETKIITVSEPFRTERVEFLAENTAAAGYFFDADLKAFGQR